MPFPPIDPTLYVTCPAQASPPIASNRYCRNGQYPDAALMTALATSANQVVRNRPKEMFRGPGDLTAIPNSNGSRNRWRFAGHTGPYLSGLHVIFTLAMENDRLNGHNPHATITIKDPTGATTYGSATYYYGAWSQVALPDTPFYFGTADLLISGVPADTDIVGLIADNDTSRVVSATVYEVSLLPTVANGYTFAHYPVTSPILETDRAAVATIGKNVWKRGSRQLLNWCTDLDVGVAVSNATKNLVDTTASTTVGGATPGFQLDTSFDVRASQSTVPIVIAMYGSRGAVASTACGVQLKNSAGTVVQVSGLPSTAGWSFVTTSLPAMSTKWDLQIWNTAAFSINVGAVSVFEYES